MRKTIVATLTSLLLFSSAFTKEKTFPEVRQVIPITDLTTEVLQEFVTGMHPEIAIEFKPGTSIPLRFVHNFGHFSAALDPNLALKVEKGCYLRVIKRKPYLSEDLIHWEKAAYDYFNRGKCKAQLKITDDGALVDSALVPYPEVPYSDDDDQ